MSRNDPPNPFRLRATAVWVVGAGLAVALALIAAIQPTLGIAALVTLALAAGFSRSTTFAMCAFVAATYSEIIVTYTGNATLSPIKFTGGALILLALLLLVLRVRGGTAIARPAWASNTVVIGSLIAFLIVACASVSWAASVEQVSALTQRIATEVLIFLAIGVLLHRVRQFSALAWTALGCGALATVFGIVTGANLGGRMIGTFADPNDYAAAMLVSMAMGFGALGSTRGSVARVVGMLSVVLCGYGLLSSQSRGGLIAGVVALLVVVLTSRGRERMRMMGATLVLGALMASFLMFTPNGQATIARVTDGDSSGRGDLWHIAQMQFRDRPITGQGLGNFPFVAIRFITPDMRETDLVTRAPRTTHNAYLEVAAELGLLGLTTFGTLIASCLVLLMRGLRASRRLGDAVTVRLGRALLASTIGLLATCVFLSGQYYELFWVMLAGGVAFHAMVQRRLALAAALETARLVVDGIPVDQLEFETSGELLPAALDELDAASA